MLIRPATSADAAAIARVILPVIRDGATYALDPGMGEAAALAWWLGGDHEPFVAIDEGRVVGTYYLRANQAGGGAHVANCGYMTAGDATGRGVARAMAEHSFAHARAHGFTAMQYNFVVSTNDRAVRLWQSLGFAIVGRLPGAFIHPQQGPVDTFIMHRAL